MSGALQTILLIGPPGVGKSTLGRALESAGGMTYLGIGDVFRRLDPASPSGRLHAEYVARGELLPDALTVSLLHDALAPLRTEHTSSGCLLLDGFPRTPGQRILFPQHLDVQAVIVLEAPDEIVLERSARRALEQRREEQDIRVRIRRLETHHKITAPLVSTFSNAVVFRIDASSSSDTVAKEVLRQLRKYTDHDLRG